MANEEKYLNSIPGFSWASAGRNAEGLGKVAIAGESFWLRDCHQDDNGRWHGVVDNDLVCTEEHGLKYNDTICFDVK